MSRRARALAVPLLVAALLSSTGCPQATEPAPDPEQQARSEPQPGEALLRRIVQAERTQVYSGYRRTIMGAPGEHRESRVHVFHDGAGNTLVEWGSGDEARTRWRYKSRFHWIEDPDLLLENYRVEFPAEETPPVAWRATRSVRLVGNRKGRPSMTLWVDRETSLVLREQLTDHEGKVRLTSFFETLELGPPTDRAVPTDAESLRPGGVVADPEGWTPLRVTRAPPGFKRVSRGVLACGTLREYWSDGLAAFSVTQIPDGGSEEVAGELKRSERQGRISLKGVFGGLRLTVSGVLPAICIIVICL